MPIFSIRVGILESSHGIKTSSVSSGIVQCPEIGNSVAMAKPFKTVVNLTWSVHSSRKEGFLREVMVMTVPGS